MFIVESQKHRLAQRGLSNEEDALKEKDRGKSRESSRERRKEKKGK